MFDLLAAPTARLLDACFALWPSYGGAIVLFTATVASLLSPLAVHAGRRQLANQAKLQALRPDLDRLRTRHRNDQQRLQQETAALFAAHGVTPASMLGGIGAPLLQSPVLIAVFQVLKGLGRPDPRYLPLASGLRDAIIADHGRLLSVGIDLAATPASAIAAGLGTAVPALLLLAALVAVSLAGASLTRRRTGTTNPVVWIGALLTPAFAFGLPAGLALSYVVTTTARVAQQAYIHRVPG
jgi:YidC/Oxa1 family membrane protein insertase